MFKIRLNTENKSPKDLGKDNPGKRNGKWETWSGEEGWNAEARAKRPGCLQ